MEVSEDLIPALYIVATPIGNLKDITFRALEILKKCDLIACEDTRVSLKLLNYFDIQKPLITYKDANEKKLAPLLLEKIKSGQKIALISDAGTPNISDPGFKCIHLCRKENIPVIPIPGPCALSTALSASGLPSHAFFFTGFLEPKKSARLRFFDNNKDYPYSIILYESCHRIMACIKDLIDVLGPDRIISIAREITKKFETFYTGPSLDVLKQIETTSQKGEFVLIIAPKSFTL